MEIKHGTRSTHNNHHCRCTLCVAANRTYRRDRYMKLKYARLKAEAEAWSAAHPEVPVIEVFPVVVAEPAD